MFTNKAVRCFLCFCKESPERTFHAHSTLCPGSVEPLKEVIEDLARSAKLEVHLAEDTLLCLECCKIVATFLQNKRDLLDRIEKAMTYLDNELDEEPIIKQEKCDAETAQDPFFDNFNESLIDDIVNDTNMEEEPNIKKYKKNEEGKLIIEQSIEETQRTSATTDKSSCNDKIKRITHKANTKCKKNENKQLFIKRRRSKKANNSANEETLAKGNSSENEMSGNEQMSIMQGRKYKCDLCNYAHYDENHLILHKSTHKGLKETQCPFCFKFLSKKSHCLRHMESHTNFEKYQCHKCGIRFSQSIKFNNHKMQHDAEENPLFCTICGRRFKTIKTLKTHAITHRADRPRYTCEYCGKIFVDRYTRTVHLREKHRKEDLEKQDSQKPSKRQNITKQSTCIICTESFTNKEQLDNHMESEHDVILKPVATLPES